MSDSIDDIFNSLQSEIDEFAQLTAKTFLHKTTVAITEKWAKDIISLILAKKLTPKLSDETLRRRKSRGKSIISNDIPFLETGEWITYIEFKINQQDDHDEIIVGVFDDTTQIGHTSNRTPSFIARIAEYGYEDENLYIPARYLFSASKLRINSQVEKIIESTWNKLKLKDITNEYAIPTNLTGKIVYNGSNFIFRWDNNAEA